jgi:hypothetical protein
VGIDPAPSLVVARKSEEEQVGQVEGTECNMELAVAFRKACPRSGTLIQMIGLGLSDFPLGPPYTHQFAVDGEKERKLDIYEMSEFGGIQAFEMKAAMHRVSVQPSVVTYHSLIGICVKLGDVSNFHHPSACPYQCLLTLLCSLTRDLVAQVGYCTPSCTTPH